MRARRQDGLTLVFVALLMTGLCGATALAVDIGMLFAAKGAAQNAADAAALAGAFTFLKPANSQPTAAQNAAVALANSNAVLGQQVNITSANVTVDTANHRVTVSVPRTVPGFFSTVLGFASYNLSATATAEASPDATGSTCLRPIFVPNTILSTETPSQACTDGQTILDANGNITAWAMNYLGTLETIRPITPGGALAPSQYYSLDFSNGNGGGSSMYSCSLAQPLASCGVSPAIASCGTQYLTENGDMRTPTVTGVGNLLGPTPDTWVGQGAYQHANGTVTDTSAQLIVAPVWDDCNDPIGAGGGWVKIIGFSNWFVQGVDTSGTDPGVVGNFVNAAGCGAGGGGNGGGIATNASFGIPVRLVTPN